MTKLPEDFFVGGKVNRKYLHATAITSVMVFEDMNALDAYTEADEGDAAIVIDVDGEGTRQSFLFAEDGKWYPISSPVDIYEEELAAAVYAGLIDVNRRLEALEGKDD
jgi:hypothetical protein